jgi:hypothetical protein
MDEKQFNKVFDKEVEKLKENIAKEKFVVYPEIPLTINDFKNGLNMSDDKKEEGFIFTPKVEEEGLIKEFPSLDAQAEEPEEETINTNINEIVLDAKGGFSLDENEEKIDISSIKPVEEIIPAEVAVIETETLQEQNLGEEPEKKELTEEEKRAKLIEAIKQAHIRYHPKKHFGVAYKQKRKAKNRMQKKSRKNSK